MELGLESVLTPSVKTSLRSIWQTVRYMKYGAQIVAGVQLGFELIYGVRVNDGYCVSLFQSSTVLYM